MIGGLQDRQIMTFDSLGAAQDYAYLHMAIILAGNEDDYLEIVELRSFVVAKVHRQEDQRINPFPF